MQRPPHILNAASNLLGISLLVITGLKFTHRSEHTLADEIAWIACAAFTVSCLLAYLSIRDDAAGGWHEKWADKAFIAGLVALVGAVIIFAASTLP